MNKYKWKEMKRDIKKETFNSFRQTFLDETLHEFSKKRNREKEAERKTKTKRIETSS